MKALKVTLLTAVVLLGAAQAASAFAHGGRPYRHGRVGVYIGAPVLFAPFYYPPRYYPYYPPVVVQREPTVYIEQGAAAPQPQQSGAYWYYCPDSQTYYPYVEQCAVPWQRVVPRPPPS